MIAPQVLDQADQAHVVLDNASPFAGILEVHLRHRSVVRNRDKPHPDLIHLVLQGLGMVQVFREIRDERLHPPVSRVARLPEGEKHILLPTSARVGGDAHGIGRLRGGRRQRGGCEGSRESPARDRHAKSLSQMQALPLRVELAPVQRDHRQQVHPNQQCDHRADAAVQHVIVGDVADVPGEAGGGQQP